MVTVVNLELCSDNSVFSTGQRFDVVSANGGLPGSPDDQTKNESIISEKHFY